MVPIAQTFISKLKFGIEYKVVSLSMSVNNFVIILVGMVLFG